MATDGCHTNAPCLRRDTLRLAAAAAAALSATPEWWLAAQQAPATVGAAELEHRTIRVNGVGLQVATQGTGPLVILCHGWPELWYAWRHQLPALAAALDLRDFGASDAPAEIEAYTVMHLVGDAVGLIGALGERQAVVVGHDWGATVAWHAALFRPDLVRAVVGMSVHFFRIRPPVPPVRALWEAGQIRFTGSISRSLAWPRRSSNAIPPPRCGGSSSAAPARARRGARPERR